MPGKTASAWSSLALVDCSRFNEAPATCRGRLDQAATLETELDVSLQ